MLCESDCPETLPHGIFGLDYSSMHWDTTTIFLDVSLFYWAVFLPVST